MIAIVGNKSAQAIASCLSADSYMTENQYAIKDILT